MIHVGARYIKNKGKLLEENLESNILQQVAAIMQNPDTFATGTLGVFGPIHMAYDSAISAVLHWLT
tara:strand:+ start:692 stop:889 length:198 start_codon:yes stop_codon:yes gene_type:complete